MPRAGSIGMEIDQFVLDRLAQVEATFKELNAKLEDPDIMANVDELLRVNKERAKIEPTVTAYQTYLSLEQQAAEAKEMFQEAGDDVEIKEMAREELKDLESQMEALDEELKLLLLPSDPNDEKNVSRKPPATQRALSRRNVMDPISGPGNGS